MKKLPILFFVVCMVLCLIPSVGMLFFPTTETTENKAMAAAPQLLTEDGQLNQSFIADFEDWFTEHIALRNPLVYADAMIQSKLFQESNVSGVITGTDGWLYYASTLSDYLGTDVMEAQDLSNLAHNFSVVQDYVEAKGMDFVLTIPPNKNTLYGENMPYYKSYIVDVNHSARLLEPYLDDAGINYLNLFRLFREQDEVLYLLRDSHWNTKGACLAYNAIMDSLGLSHEDYSSKAPTLVENENGDLNKMLYSFYGELEANYVYDMPQEYVYENDVESVEDGWIITQNESGAGTLLMFRDSFGNTLIPFLSNEFKTAYYSKGEPNALERYVETYAPDCVVIEKVERNIANYLTNPPILTPTTVRLPENLTIAKTDTTLQIENCLNDFNYYKLSGEVDKARLQEGSEILVCVGENAYRTYFSGENGFFLYLKKDVFAQTTLAQVYVVTGDHCVEALTTTVQLPQ